MRFTNTIRDEIVIKVFSDIETETRQQVQERLQKLVDADIKKNGPKAVKNLWGTPDKMYLNIRSISIRDYCEAGREISRELYINYLANFKPSKHTAAALVKETLDFTAKTAERQAAKTKLQSALLTVNTLKQFLDTFPELAKYAPQEVGMDRSVPAVANVMAELTKLGWPKGKK